MNFRHFDSYRPYPKTKPNKFRDWLKRILLALKVLFVVLLAIVQ
jgi:hypothetical protein